MCDHRLRAELKCGHNTEQIDVDDIQPRSPAPLDEILGSGHACIGQTDVYTSQGSMALEIDIERLRRWRYAITVCFGLGGLTVATWGPRLPAIQSSFGLSPGTIGLVLAGATGGSVIGMAGAASARRVLGGRSSLTLAAVLMGTGLLGTALAIEVRSLPGIALGFLLVGLGVGLIDVLSNVEGAEVERRLGRTLLPMMHAAWSIGVALGAGVGAACEAMGVSPTAQFAGEGLVLIATGLMITRGVPSWTGPPEVARAPSGAGLRNLFTRLDRRLFLIGLVMFGVEIGEGAANSWLSLSVVLGHGLSPNVAALLYVVFAVSEALARVTGGPVVDRIGRVRTIRYTSLLGAVGVCVFIATDRPTVLLLAVVLWAVGVSMGFPLGMSAAATGADSAVRVSVVASIGVLANLGGPPVIGAVADAKGLLVALLLVVGCLILAAMLASSLREGDGAQPASRSTA